MEKTTDLPQVTDKLSHNVVSSTPCLSGVRTHSFSIGFWKCCDIVVFFVFHFITGICYKFSVWLRMIGNYLQVRIFSLLYFSHVFQISQHQLNGALTIHVQFFNKHKLCGAMVMAILGAESEPNKVSFIQDYPQMIPVEFQFN